MPLDVIITDLTAKEGRQEGKVGRKEGRTCTGHWIRNEKECWLFVDDKRKNRLDGPKVRLTEI